MSAPQRFEYYDITPVVMWESGDEHGTVEAVDSVARAQHLCECGTASKWTWALYGRLWVAHAGVHVAEHIGDYETFHGAAQVYEWITGLHAPAHTEAAHYFLPVKPI